MTSTRSKSEKIAVAVAVVGATIVLVMPFLSVPFHVPNPQWTLTLMEHAIYLMFVSLFVFLVGVPASFIAIVQKRSWIAWAALVGCLGTWPLGVAAIYGVAFLFGEQIST
jgi:hypothetical protein